MGIKTGIEFCDSTRNIMMGCDGCELWTEKMEENGTATCYAASLTSRYAGKNGWPVSFGQPKIFPERINVNWPNLTGTERKDRSWLDGLPRVIFECDMSDIWTESLDVMWMEPYLEKMTSDGHIHLFITKRPKRAYEFFSCIGQIPENFWILTTVTSNKNKPRANDLVKLREIRGDVTLGISAEPLYDEVLFGDLPIDWIIVGGESGKNSRAMPARAPYVLLDEAKKYHRKFFMKQLGGYPNKRGNLLDFPSYLRVRQMPEV